MKNHAELTMWKVTFAFSLLLYNHCAVYSNAGKVEKVVAVERLGSNFADEDLSGLAYNINHPLPHNRHFTQRNLIHDFNDDHELEEKLRNGEIDIHGNPIILGKTSRHSWRSLSESSAKIGTFGRLECNPSSWSGIDCSKPVSNIVLSDSPLIVPCGQCYTFDLTGNVTLDGINIKGKLQFPINHKAVINTPYVIVQGELEIAVNHDQISPHNTATRFVLTGTEDVIFAPSDPPNANACEQTGGTCNIGPKPFLVAGGKVNFNAMPEETCATHTPLKKKIHTDPEYDPDDFPKFTTLPPSCPQSGTGYISYDFNDNKKGNWTGCDGSFLRTSNGEFTVTNRKRTDCGPELDLTPIRPEMCLVPHQEYLFVSR